MAAFLLPAADPDIDHRTRGGRSGGSSQATRATGGQQLRPPATHAGGRSGRTAQPQDHSTKGRAGGADQAQDFIYRKPKAAHELFRALFGHIQILNRPAALSQIRTRGGRSRHRPRMQAADQEAAHRLPEPQAQPQDHRAKGSARARDQAQDFIYWKPKAAHGHFRALFGHAQIVNRPAACCRSGHACRRQLRRQLTGYQSHRQAAAPDAQRSHRITEPKTAPRRIRRRILSTGSRKPLTVISELCLAMLKL